MGPPPPPPMVWVEDTVLPLPTALLGVTVTVPVVANVTEHVLEVLGQVDALEPPPEPLHAQAVGGLVLLQVALKFSVVFADWLFDPGEIEQPLGAPGPPPPPPQVTVMFPLPSTDALGDEHVSPLIEIDIAWTGAP